MHLHVQWTISSHGCQWYDSFEPHSRGWKRVSAPTYNSWIFGTHTFDASTLQLQLSVREHIKTDLQFQVDNVLKQENGFNLVQCPEARATDIKDGIAIKMIDRTSAVSMVCCKLVLYNQN